EDVFSSQQGFAGESDVRRWRRSDAHRIDFRQPWHVEGRGARPARQAVLHRRMMSTFLIAADDADHFKFPRALESRHVAIPRNPAGADAGHTNASAFGHGHGEVLADSLARSQVVPAWAEAQVFASRARRARTTLACAVETRMAKGGPRLPLPLARVA